MKLFLKHILRSMRHAPLQPLLIILTVAVAVSLSVMAFAVSGMFADRAEQTAQSATAAGDLLISMRADSGARILFEEDAAALLGDDGRVLGEFRLTGVLSNEEGSTLSLSCTDLLAADEFYRFSYTVYGSFHEKTLDRTAILSASAAAAHGLSVGDEFTLRVLEQEFVYTVGAIAADTGLLAQCDALVSIDGIVATLADRMPIISSLGDSFRPYTRLMIKLSDGADADAVVQRFQASSAFADKQVSLTESAAYGDFWVTMQLVFLWATLILMLVLVAFVLGTSLTLLHRRRAGEYALFAMVGASPAQLRGLILLESALYALWGGLGGVALGFPVTRTVASFYEWRTTPLWVRLPDALGGFFLGFAIVLICTLQYLSRSAPIGLSREHHRSEQTRERLLCVDWLPAATLLSVSILLMVCLPVRLRFAAGLAAGLSLVWLLFVLLPLLLRLLSGGAASRLLRARRMHASAWLSLKNLCHRYSLRHAGRLLAVMLALLLSLLTCERVLSGQLDNMTFDEDRGVVALGVSEQTEQALAAHDTVKGVIRLDLRKGATVNGCTGATAMSISGDVYTCLDASLLPSRMPTGDEAVLSEGLAELAGVERGDRIDCMIGGVPCTLTVTEIQRSNANVLYYDAEPLGIRQETLCVTLREGSPEQIERVSAMIEADGGFVIRNGSLFGSAQSSMSGHVRFLRVTLLLSLILSLLGVGNMLVQQRDVREHERELLALCGMTKRDIHAMQLLETAGLLLLTGAIAVLAAGAICLIVDLSLRSFGMLLFV